MNVIFDFDNTLFDSASFSRAIYRAIGLDESKALESYVRHFSQKRRPYSFSGHLPLLLSDGLLATSEIDSAKVAAESVLIKCRDYVYQDAWGILRALHKRGDNIEVLTMGDPSWQSLKLSHSGLAEYAHRVVVALPPKSQYLPLYKGMHDLVFVNDNVVELLEAARIFPEAKCVLIDGKHARDVEHKMPIYPLSRLQSLLALS